MSKVTRTVKNDLTVTIGGHDYEPKDNHSKTLMRGWVGMRIQVEDANYWGTVLHASPRLPAHNVMDVANLYSPA